MGSDSHHRKKSKSLIGANGGATFPRPSAESTWVFILLSLITVLLIIILVFVIIGHIQTRTIKNNTSPIKGYAREGRGEEQEEEEEGEEGGEGGMDMIEDDIAMIKNDTSIIINNTEIIIDNTEIIIDNIFMLKNDTSIIIDNIFMLKNDTSMIKNTTNEILIQVTDVCDEDQPCFGLGLCSNDTDCQTIDKGTGGVLGKKCVFGQCLYRVISLDIVNIGLFCDTDYFNTACKALINLPENADIIPCLKISSACLVRHPPPDFLFLIDAVQCSYTFKCTCGCVGEECTEKE